MSRLDALEKAVVSLAKQAGLAYDLNGTGLENDPLGDADNDGVPNIMDSHPRSPIQTGIPLKRAPTVAPPNVAPINTVTVNNSELINTLTTLVLLQLVNNLQGSQGQFSGLGQNTGHDAGAGIMQPNVPKPVQEFSDLQYDYVYLYDMYEKTYFFDDSNTPVDGSALVAELVATHNIPTSQQALNASYGGPKDYTEMRGHYRKLWDSYNTNIGRPPHFAQER